LIVEYDGYRQKSAIVIFTFDILQDFRQFIACTNVHVGFSPFNHSIIFQVGEKLAG
jgi:hypothetical protein